MTRPAAPTRPEASAELAPSTRPEVSAEPAIAAVDAAALEGEAASVAPAASTVFRPKYRLDISVAVMWVKTVKPRRGVYWWATDTPLGPATVAFRAVGTEVRADGWGPGAGWGIEQLPALLGNDDDPSGFRPLDPVVRDLIDRRGPPRIGATGRWYEALATTALFQRVVRADAAASVARLGRRHGPVPPGPDAADDPAGRGPVPVFPGPEAVKGLADHHFHRAGVERSRTRVVRMAAVHADRLEGLGARPAAEARQWLTKLPGVGVWTAARTTGAAAGDPDAVPVGDLHVPRIVTYALIGENGGDDARMLELLEPYAGHRGRVVKMIKAAGLGPPRHFPAPTRFDISPL